MNATRTIADFPHIKPICADDYISLPGQFLDMMSRATWRRKGPDGAVECRPVPFHAWRYYAALCKWSNRWGESWWRVRSAAAELQVTPEALAQSRRVLLESEYDGVPLAVSYAGGHARSESLHGKRILAKVTWLPHRDRSGWVAPRECACGVVDTPRVSGSSLHCPACGDDVSGAPFIPSASPSALERARAAAQDARRLERQLEHLVGRAEHHADQAEAAAEERADAETRAASELAERREAWERAGTGDGADLIGRSDRSYEEIEEPAPGPARDARVRAREACTSSETLARPDCPPAARGPGAASPRGGGPDLRETADAIPGGCRPPDPPRVVKMARVEIPDLVSSSAAKRYPGPWPVSLFSGGSGSEWVGVVVGAPGPLAAVWARQLAERPGWRAELLDVLEAAGVRPVSRKARIEIRDGYREGWYQSGPGGGTDG